MNYSSDENDEDKDPDPRWRFGYRWFSEKRKKGVRRSLNFTELRKSVDIIKLFQLITGLGVRQVGKKERRKFLAPCLRCLKPESLILYGESQTFDNFCSHCKTDIKGGVIELYLYIGRGFFKNRPIPKQVERFELEGNGIGFDGFVRMLATLAVAKGWTTWKLLRSKNDLNDIPRPNFGRRKIRPGFYDPSRDVTNHIIYTSLVIFPTEDGQGTTEVPDDDSFVLSPETKWGWKL